MSGVAPAPPLPFAPDVFAGRRFAVVGLGRNGLPAARALAAMGAVVVAWDDGEAARAAAAPALAQAGVTLQDPAPAMARFDALVLSPGIPHLRPAPHPSAAAAAATGVPVWSDAELLFQAVRRSDSAARFVGITGTNGKSTTTALLAHVVKSAGMVAQTGGNIGIPALSLQFLGDQGVYVLEFSSYMLERLTTVRLNISVLLNLSADHLDRHDGMAGYVAAKRAAFDRQTRDDLAVVGVDDSWCRELASELGAATISGWQPADTWCDGAVLRDAAGPLLDLRAAPALPGVHNAQNAAAAATAALRLGVSRAQVAAGIASFAGLPHRQQRVAERAGVVYVDDSKATNADAAARALACYGRVVWIAGGIAKEGGIEALRPLLPRVAHAVLIGRDAPLLARTLADAGVPHSIAGTLDAAVPEAARLAGRLDAPVVLLSPACASFDQFTGFEARGARFAELAHALPNRAVSLNGEAA